MILYSHRKPYILKQQSWTAISYCTQFVAISIKLWVKGQSQRLVCTLLHIRRTKSGLSFNALIPANKIKIAYSSYIKECSTTRPFYTVYNLTFQWSWNRKPIFWMIRCMSIPQITIPCQSSFQSFPQPPFPQDNRPVKKECAFNFMDLVLSDKQTVCKVYLQN